MSGGRDADRRETPRLTCPLADRRRFAVAWYVDQVRSSDIAVVACLSHGDLSAVIQAARVPVRQTRAGQRHTPMLALLRAVTGGASAEGLRQAFGLSDTSIEGLLTLHRESRPVKAAPTRSHLPPRRCRVCAGVTVGERCQWCGTFFQVGGA